jgi:hypothetical protein
MVKCSLPGRGALLSASLLAPRVALAHDPGPVVLMGMLMSMLFGLAIVIVLGLPLWLLYGRTAWKRKVAVATSVVALWILGFLGVLAMD